MEYPADWAKEIQGDEISWQLSLQGPGTALVMVACDFDHSPVELLEAAVETLREDYPEMEVEATEGEICGVASEGMEIRFFSFDLPNLCKIETIPSEDGSFLFLFQCNDFDAAEAEPFFQSIRSSMKMITG